MLPIPQFIDEDEIKLLEKIWDDVTLDKKNRAIWLNMEWGIR